MARKRGNKKLSKEEFIATICVNKCFICTGENVDPSFCFNHLYRRKPKIFINSVLENYYDFWQELVELQNSCFTSDEAMLGLFRKVICDTNLCKRCAAADFDVYLCIAKFMDQNDSVFEHTWDNPAKRKPKPFLFMHKDVKFKEEIDRILENYAKQQDFGGGLIAGH